MDVREYIRVLRKHGLLLAVTAATTLALATGFSLVVTPTYESRTQLFVSTQASRSAQDLVQGGNFTQQRVKSYADIVRTPTVLRPVIEQLGLALSAAELQDRVTAEAPLDTVLINISVRDASPTRAAEIANAVSLSFVRVLTQLEQPSDGSLSLVKASIVQPAETPSSPVSPNLALNLALGLVVGLILGIGAALLREAMDTTVRTEQDIRRVSQGTILGAVPFDEAAAKQPLIVHGDPFGPRSEAFRTLRTNLQFVDVTKHPKVIVVTSSIPGEGKTTTVANMAITLTAAGRQVAVLEADLRRPKLADAFGLENGVGLTTVLIGRAELDDVLQPWGDGRLHVLASGALPPNPSELLGSQAMADVLHELGERFDLVLIDAPPLLPVTDAAVLSRMADGALFVIGSGRIAREQLRRALEALNNVGAVTLGLVLNRAPVKGPDAYHRYAYSYSPTKPGDDSTDTTPPEDVGAGATLAPAAHRRSAAPQKGAARADAAGRGAAKPGPGARGNRSAG